MICVEHIKNPVSVARLILENTEHVCLAGEGAYNFAITNGFQPDILHTENSIKNILNGKKEISAGHRNFTQMSIK